KPPLRGHRPRDGPRMPRGAGRAHSTRDRLNRVVARESRRFREQKRPAISKRASAPPHPATRVRASPAKNLPSPVSSRAATVASLRQLLAERFPQASRPVGGVVPTGIPSADETAGGLPRHALSELVCPSLSAGGHLFLSQLLAGTRARAARVALIDAADQFDPCSFPSEDLEHLVWVRCTRAADAL